MFTFLKNTFANIGKYKEHPEAVIISCFFNPENSEYRLKAFNHFYNSIKHMNHLIVECTINSKRQLSGPNIIHVESESTLWHKEALLNLAIKKLPNKYRFVFWVDADVIFTNLNWLTDSVKEFQKGVSILQPFEYCVHMDKDEFKPNFKLDKSYKDTKGNLTNRPAKMWRSFCANYVDSPLQANSTDYNSHGHVGFAWGARREILNAMPLYDKALVGGADHIMAHAAAGQFPSKCIDKSFTEDLDSVYKWSRKFYEIIDGIGYVEGDLYHIWHGDIEKRQYLKRIQDFTPTTKEITEKDKNGLYVAKNGKDQYVKEYFKYRENSVSKPKTKVVNTPKATTSVIHEHWHYNSNWNNGSISTPKNNMEVNQNIPSEEAINASENFS